MFKTKLNNIKITNNNRKCESKKLLKVHLLLKELFILAVTNINVWYGECSSVYLFDVDGFSHRGAYMNGGANWNRGAY